MSGLRALLRPERKPILRSLRGCGVSASRSIAQAYVMAKAPADPTHESVDPGLGRSDEVATMTIASDRHAKRWRKKQARKNFRRAVLARAKVPGGWRCERCRKVFPYEDQIEAHHKLPRSQGGSNCVTNGHALCRAFGEINCHNNVHLHINDGLSPWCDWIVVRNTLGKTAWLLQN